MEAEQGDVAIADDALGIDDEDRPPHEPARPQHPVGANDLALRVCQQRNGQPVLGAESLVRVERLRRDPPDRGVELVESVRGVAVRAELASAHWREVARIEGQHDPLPEVLGKPVGAAARPRELEVGRRVAAVDACHGPYPPLTLIRRMTTVARGVPRSPLAGSPSVPIRFTTFMPESTFPRMA